MDSFAATIPRPAGGRVPQWPAVGSRPGWSSLVPVGELVHETFRSFVARQFATAGRAWLESLPKTLAAVAAECGPRLGAELHGGVLACVLEARTALGEEVVLKVAGPWDRPHDEIACLRRWGGRGAPRLIHADPYRGAFLLERIRPATAATDATADEVARLIGLLHTAPADPVPPLGEVVRARIEQAVAQGRPLPSRPRRRLLRSSGWRAKRPSRCCSTATSTTATSCAARCAAWPPSTRCPLSGTRPTTPRTGRTRTGSRASGSGSRRSRGRSARTRATSGAGARWSRCTAEGPQPTLCCKVLRRCAAVRLIQSGRWPPPTRSPPARRSPSAAREHEIYRLDALQSRYDVLRLPYTLRILLENVLRTRTA